MPLPAVAVVILAGIASGLVVAAGTKLYDYLQAADKQSDAWEGLFHLFESASRNRPDVIERLGRWYVQNDEELDQKSIAFKVTTSADQARVYFQKNPWYKSDKVFVVGSKDTLDYKSNAQVAEPAELRRTIIAQANLIAQGQQTSDKVPA